MLMTPEEIQSLVAAKKPEGPQLEFKQELPGNSDSDKKEFLADVCAFANASGGTILYGIQEEDGSAAAITGVELTNSDECIRRLSSLIRDGIEPRISGIEIAVVDVDGKSVITLRTRQSYARPHWVTLKGTNRFYLRHAADRAPMSLDEVRSAFLSGSSAAEKAASWRQGRVNEIAEMTTRRFVTVVLHLIPLSAAYGGGGPKLNPSDPIVRKLATILHRTANVRPNHLGALTSNSLGEDRLYDYLQIYRDFCIEGVFEGGVNPDKRAGLIATDTENSINEWLTSTKPWFVEVGYPFPCAVFVSITSDRPTTLMEGLQSPTTAERSLLFESSAIEDADFEAHAVMRPIYDHIWQTCGVSGSPNYDAGGNWVRRGWRP